MTELDRVERSDRKLQIEYAIGNLKQALRDLEPKTDVSDKSSREYMDLAIKNLQGD